MFINFTALYSVLNLRNKLHHVSSICEKVEFDGLVAANQLSYILAGNDLENQLITDPVLLEINNYPKFIIRFSSYNCESCIQMLITNLELYKDQIGIENIVFLGSFHSNSEFNLYKKKFANLGEVIECKRLPHSIDTKNLPYFFVVDEFQRFDDVFIPEKNNPSILDSYLKSIVTRFQFKC